MKEFGRCALQLFLKEARALGTGLPAELLELRVPPERADAEKTPGCVQDRPIQNSVRQALWMTSWTLLDQALRLHSGTFLRQA